MLLKENFVKQKWISNWSKNSVQNSREFWFTLHNAEELILDIYTVYYTTWFFTKLQRAQKLCGVFAGREGESQEVRSLVKEKSLWR